MKRDSLSIYVTEPIKRGDPVVITDGTVRKLRSNEASEPMVYAETHLAVGEHGFITTTSKWKNPDPTRISIYHRQTVSEVDETAFDRGNIE